MDGTRRDDLVSGRHATGSASLEELSVEELAAPPGSVRLVIRPTSTGETGVFSVRRIPAGRLVESCHVLPLSEEELATVLDTSLAGCVTDWPAGGALLTGCGPIYRHSDEPNAFFVTDHASSVVRLFSLREILPGQEVLVAQFRARPTHVHNVP